MKRPPGYHMLKRVRSLRRELTPAERLLWSRLRNRRLEGFKFRCQMWLCGYIADFACPEAMLIVEADGSQHAEAEQYDERRSEAFEQAGFRTLRFWNNEIFENLDGVLGAIRAALPSPSHPASPGGPLQCRTIAGPIVPPARSVECRGHSTPGERPTLPNWERGA